MLRPEPKPQKLAPADAAAKVLPVGDDHGDGRYGRSWPAGRLLGAALTLSLVLSLGIPVALAADDYITWLALVIPVALCTVIARAVFDALAVAVPRPDLVHYLRAGLPAAAVAVGAMLICELVLTVMPTVALVAVSSALVLATLMLALAMRALEVRMRLSSRRVCFIGVPERRADLDREIRRRGDMRLVAGVAIAEVDNRPGVAWLAGRISESRATTLVLDAEAMRSERIVRVASEAKPRGPPRPRPQLVL